MSGATGNQPQTDRRLTLQERQDIVRSRLRDAKQVRVRSSRSQPLLTFLSGVQGSRRRVRSEDIPEATAASRVHPLRHEPMPAHTLVRATGQPRRNVPLRRKERRLGGQRGR